MENEVLNRIRELCRFRHWSVYRLAKEADIPYSSLNNIFNRNTVPSIPTLEKICEGFNITLSDFFEYKKNPLRQESMTEEEQELLESYRALSLKDRGLLKAYMNGLLKR